MTDLRKAAENILKVLDGKPELLGSWLERLKEAREALRQALAQPEWVGLTAEEVNSIVNLSTFDDAGYDIFTDGSQVARIVEIRLKEKNT